jgi:hypothetical protein
MRCANCGLPLSPARTQCPGCGAANSEKPGKQNEHAANQGEVPQYAFPLPQNGNGFPTTPTNGNAQWPYIGTPEGQQARQPTGREMPQPAPFPDAGQPGQLWLPGGSPNRQTSDWRPTLQPGLENTAPPQKLKRANGKSSARLNFTIAGLCVLTGGLILIFVYIISFSLPPTAASSQQAAVATATARSVSPTSQGVATNATATMTAPMTLTATPVVTPTVGLPGQHYVDTVRMASAVNTTTAQPTQSTNRFKVKQPIFVTFMLHPQNTGGAVCLLWYLNQKPFSHYAFAVDITTQSAYSYAYAGSPGSGSVEIYWASTTACTDKALAQVVNFTVSP